MSKKFGIALFAVLLVSFVVAPCGAAELVQNGGFETGDFSSWTVTPSLIFPNIAVNAADPHSGTYAAAFGSSNLDDSISQTLATVPGQSYTFSFWLANDTSTRRVSNDFSASWNGTTALSLTNYGPFSYTQYSFTEIAGPSPTVITFSGTGGVIGPGFSTASTFYLDDVSVAVPEPVSLLLFGAGLVGMAVIGRKNRKEEI